MRALILVAGAALAIAACGDRADRYDGNEVVIVNDPDANADNWVEVNTDEANAVERCAPDRKCLPAPDVD